VADALADTELFAPEEGVTEEHHTEENVADALFAPADATSTETQE
jgi:hypothetical protein